MPSAASSQRQGFRRSSESLNERPTRREGFRILLIPFFEPDCTTLSTSLLSVAVAPSRQGWEDAAERPEEVVHASYEVVFAPMVFVRKVGSRVPAFFTYCGFGTRM